MITALAYLALIALVLLVEVLSHHKLQQLRHNSVVSSLPPAPISTSASLQIACKCLNIIAFCTSLTGLLLGLSLLGIAPAVLILIALRTAITQLMAANITRAFVNRYMQALDAPNITRARMALYFSEPRLGTPYQVTMWLKPLLSLNEPFVIILKERKHLTHFPKSELYEVLIVADLPAGTAFLPSNVEVMFYVNNSMTNLPVIAANPDVTHVQLLHGDSDKPPSYNPMSAVYDRLFVAGEMAIDRYARHGVDIPREKFRIVGRPQIRPASPVEPPAKMRKSIVYMPTWSGMFDDSNFCSLPMAADILHQSLLAGYAVDMVFKPHPLSVKDPSWPEIQSQINQVTQTLPPGTSFRLVHQTEDPFKLYSQADLLITDISSTVIDYLSTDKPYIVTNPGNLTANQRAAYPSTEGGYLAAADLRNLSDLVQLSFGEDPLSDKRKALRSYAFGDFGQPPGSAFKRACAELLEKPSGNAGRTEKQPEPDAA